MLFNRQSLKCPLGFNSWSHGVGFSKEQGTVENLFEFPYILIQPSGDVTLTFDWLLHKVWFHPSKRKSQSSQFHYGTSSFYTGCEKTRFLATYFGRKNSSSLTSLPPDSLIGWFIPARCSAERIWPCRRRRRSPRWRTSWRALHPGVHGYDWPAVGQVGGPLPQADARSGADGHFARGGLRHRAPRRAEAELENETWALPACAASVWFPVDNIICIVSMVFSDFVQAVLHILHSMWVLHNTYFNNIWKQFAKDFVFDVERKALRGKLSFLWKEK